MELKLQIGSPLSALPNQEGYKFRGVTESGDLYPCVVRKSERGVHYAALESGEPIYDHLRGWFAYRGDQP